MSGQATVTIVGTGFSPATAFSLVAGDGAERPAATVVRRDDTTFFATFDLVGLAPGAYDVRAVDGLRAGRRWRCLQGNDRSCRHFSRLDRRPGGRQQPERRRIAPRRVCERGRDGHPGAGRRAGVADHGRPADPAYPRDQRRRIVHRRGRRLGGLGCLRDPAGPAAAGAARRSCRAAQFLAISQDGPAGVLPPGATGQVEVHFADDGSLDPGFHPELDFTLIVAGQADRPFDLAASKDAMRPATVSPEAWDVVFANLLARLGTTVGSYTRALDDAATYLSGFGLATDNIDRLLSLLVEQADGALPGQALSSAVDVAAPAPGLPWSGAGRSPRRSPGASTSEFSAAAGQTRGTSGCSIDPKTEQVLIRTPGGTRRFRSAGRWQLRRVGPAIPAS